VNIKNGFGVGQVDTGLGLLVLLLCTPLCGHCGGKSSIANVSCESPFDRFKQLQVHESSAMFSVETVKTTPFKYIVGESKQHTNNFFFYDDLAKKNI